MDATTRWETEALRDGDRARPSPPRPSKASQGSRTHWVTLKEAEAATGIPVNTLRKWVRRSALPSYLESDGDIALRMVDLDAVRRRARELGRTMITGQQTPDDERQILDSRQPSAPESPAWEPTVDDRQQTPDSTQGPTPQATTDTDVPTMLVPVDAWNKMLTQLGNLHEAGQQLAEARERAAKAETEATFLRERLVEMRQTKPVDREASPLEHMPDPDVSIEADEAPERPNPLAEAVGSDPATGPDRTTTYWRYLTAGWRDRRRRGAD